MNPLSRNIASAALALTAVSCAAPKTEPDPIDFDLYSRIPAENSAPQKPQVFEQSFDGLDLSQLHFDLADLTWTGTDVASAYDISSIDPRLLEQLSTRTADRRSGFKFELHGEEILRGLLIGIATEVRNHNRQR